MTVINVVGATATGKSDLAITLAHHLDGEIINADSMQFYRGMDIGTAKVSSEQRAEVPHHLLDILDVTQDASVSEYQSRARALIHEIHERGRTPIIVGGSGLYVRAATDVMNFPGTDPAMRARLEGIAEAGALHDMHAMLEELDPKAASTIKPTDARRIVRALEVIALTGDTFSSELPEYTYYTPTIQVGLAQDRETLHQRIADRVHLMWDAGWVDEVRTLLDQGLRDGKTARHAIGYAQIIDYLDGNMTADLAIDSTVTRTRQFAKRQETWFRRDPRIHWFDAADPDTSENALNYIKETA
ncbi:tRNA (adenosine(37)-N6)-dimethylallyltransferase MiaA [Brevibacterium sp. UMB1308A]|uniref:tRNA (adenosine(37)-N6)-dimethylallyltransferase MiaA n=1 Tax=Brevibacterium sp. UMB1308A TaxID=3050608 RepID=UPI00254DC97E|nr:tRNA (adenosine(37)-N6)-dimethylallyltransferase MiaA [Brevibacterium sp. UMB1308A]MDK8347037.1 tRNA (adenosine(37)-N6)-dimethylallyltransferase MiaA [Brevibacterium sp. UMB1308B]MDK8714261.1 tRNA (adenosine(37)-N6)-dimethylallyltransferase MiaA [Brevibacterium sp. UMB1308A]